MTEVTIKGKKPNASKLLSFGFEKQKDQYSYSQDIADGQMRMTVVIVSEGKMLTEVTDKNTDEEYVLHRVVDAAGHFVGQVRAEYEVILQDVLEKCFDVEVFKEEQSKRIIAYIRNTYGDELEYLWQKFPDNAIVRRKDNQKWYAAILTVTRRKLGMDSTRHAEIIDLRMKSEDIEKTVDGIRYFPGYHMNKKHWITVCLDGTLPDTEIFARIDDSYQLAKK